MNASILANLESFLAACKRVASWNDHANMLDLWNAKDLYLDGAYAAECQMANECEMAARNGDKAGLAKAADALRAFAPTAAR